LSEPLTHPYWKDDLKEPLVLYRGEVESEVEGTPLTGEGVAWLGCFPSPKVFMSFGFDSPHRFSIPIAQDSVEVALPGRGGGGVVRLGGSPDPPEGEQASHRHMVSRAGNVERFEVGATDQEVRDVRFMTINGPELHGPSAACVTLVTDTWRFVIDQRHDMHVFAKDLKWEHPFGLTHVGQLTRVDGGNIALAEANDALELLSYFLSFVRGAAVAPALPCGLDGAGTKVWEDWGSVNRRVHPYRTTVIWSDPSLTSQLAQLFTGFARRWDDEADQDVLRYVLAFYESGNDPRPLQTAINLAVAGLELMSWVQLVRDGSMPESEFEDHGARARTIEELVKCAGIDTARVPEELQALRHQGYLGHDAIWKLRSRFTHPRMHSISTDYDVLEDAWRLATWYLELVLLHWFEYEGSTYHGFSRVGLGTSPRFRG